MEEGRTEMLDELTYIQQELSSVWPDGRRIGRQLVLGGRDSFQL